MPKIRQLHQQKLSAVCSTIAQCLYLEQDGTGLEKDTSSSEILDQTGHVFLLPQQGELGCAQASTVVNDSSIYFLLIEPRKAAYIVHWQIFLTIPQYYVHLRTFVCYNSYSHVRMHSAFLHSTNTWAPRGTERHPMGCDSRNLLYLTWCATAEIRMFGH